MAAVSPPAVLCGTPPVVENAHLIGRRRSHYDIHAVVRYQCTEGFFQRHIPTIRCRADGSWERPRIICAKCECGIESSWILLKSLLIHSSICFWSPPITPVQTPSPQSAPWAPQPPEARRRRTQGQRGRTQLLLNQIILHHICKA